MARFSSFPPDLRQASAQTLLGGLSSDAIPRMSRHLGELFAARMVLSTVYTGTREEQLPLELKGDLDILAKALPAGSLTYDQELRDAAALQPAMLRYVRQVEGRPPRLPAVLCPSKDADLNDLLQEAVAAGFTISPGERQIGLWLPGRPAVLDATQGRVRISAHTSWAMLTKVAHHHGLSISPGLPDRFMTPMMAASAGLFQNATVQKRFGHAWTSDIILPPNNVEMIERTWAFHDLAVAEAALRRVVRQYAPVYAETIPYLDTSAMAAGGLWPDSRRLRDRGAGALRVIFAGPKMTRRMAMVESSWSIERSGGVVHLRNALPPLAQLEALAAAAGSARIERPLDTGGALPESAISARKLVAIHGIIEERDVIWYVRDLTRSESEAREVMGLGPKPTLHMEALKSLSDEIQASIGAMG